MMEVLATLVFAMAMLATYVTSKITELDEEWDEYKLGFNKSYEDFEEEERRRRNWENNFDLVVEHNKEADKGVHTYWLAINEFSDMSEKEFNDVYTIPIRILLDRSMASNGTFKPPGNFSVPSEMNWIEKNAVTRVKYQGYCGSCWAFSVVGGLEGATAIKTGKLVSLSEQHLVDCVAPNGCSGNGLPASYNYIRDNGGINTEVSYPYEAKEGNCRFNPRTIGATVKSWQFIHPETEEVLKHTVATMGPVPFAYRCCTAKFFQYSEGIYEDTDCDDLSLAHAMVIVGYGSGGEAGPGDWWLMKNSWGEGFGVKGYMYMRRNKNTCGVANHAIKLEV